MNVFEFALVDSKTRKIVHTKRFEERTAGYVALPIVAGEYLPSGPNDYFEGAHITAEPERHGGRMFDLFEIRNGHLAAHLGRLESWTRDTHAMRPELEALRAAALVRPIKRNAHGLYLGAELDAAEAMLSKGLKKVVGCEADARTLVIGSIRYALDGTGWTYIGPKKKGRGHRIAMSSELLKHFVD